MARAFMSKEDFPGAGVNTLYAGDFGEILRRTLYAAKSAHSTPKGKYHEQQMANVPEYKAKFLEMMRLLVSDAEQETSLDGCLKQDITSFLDKGNDAAWEAPEQISELTYNGMDYQRHMKESHMQDRYISDLVFF